MKKLIYLLLLFYIAVNFIACKSEPPSVRVYNGRTQKANVQFKTTTNTININDVQGGVTTNYQDVSEGKVDVTATIQSEAVSPTTSFNASNDNNYTVEIQNTNPPSLKVTSSGK